ncbi:hypothetical protein SNEBB_007518 [Seison nebaliae]|nr:hypothetical protein SNEBB_007518 [Seison nebaliae]
MDGIKLMKFHFTSNFQTNRKTTNNNNRYYSYHNKFHFNIFLFYGCLTIFVNGLFAQSSFLEFPWQKFTIRQYEKAYLFCRKHHPSKYTVTWKKRSPDDSIQKILSINSDYEFIDKYHEILKIDKILQKHSGTYICQTNAGVNEVNVNVIQNSPNIFRLKNSQQSDETRTIELGTRAQILCRIKEFYLNINVFWFHNYRLLLTDNRRSIGTNGTLIIHKSDESDDGVYMCSIVMHRNEIIYSPTTTLNVREREVHPYITRIFIANYFLKSSVDKSDKSITNFFMLPFSGESLLRPKKPILLSCVANGSPLPKVEWRQKPNNRLLRDSDPLRIRSVTNINDLRELSSSISSTSFYAQAIISCSAKNRLATSTIMINVNFPSKQLPKPVDLMIRVNIPNYVEVEWNMNEIIYFFLIEPKSSCNNFHSTGNYVGKSLTSATSSKYFKEYCQSNTEQKMNNILINDDVVFSDEYNAQYNIDSLISSKSSTNFNSQMNVRKVAHLNHFNSLGIDHFQIRTCEVFRRSSISTYHVPLSQTLCLNQTVKMQDFIMNHRRVTLKNLKSATSYATHVLAHNQIYGYGKASEALIFRTHRSSNTINIKCRSVTAMSVNESVISLGWNVYVHKEEEVFLSYFKMYYTAGLGSRHPMESWTVHRTDHLLFQQNFLVDAELLEHHHIYVRLCACLSNGLCGTLSDVLTIPIDNVRSNPIKAKYEILDFKGEVLSSNSLFVHWKMKGIVSPNEPSRYLLQFWYDDEKMRNESRLIVRDISSQIRYLTKSVRWSIVLDDLLSYRAYNLQLQLVDRKADILAVSNIVSLRTREYC